MCSEWVLGNREDLVKDIVTEMQPENGEVICVESFWLLLWKTCVYYYPIMTYDDFWK